MYRRNMKLRADISNIRYRPIRKPPTLRGKPTPSVLSTWETSRTNETRCRRRAKASIPAKTPSRRARRKRGVRNARLQAVRTVTKAGARSSPRNAIRCTEVIRQEGKQRREYDGDATRDHHPEWQPDLWIRAAELLARQR